MSSAINQLSIRIYQRRMNCSFKRKPLLLIQDYKTNYLNVNRFKFAAPAPLNQ